MADVAPDPKPEVTLLTTAVTAIPQFDAYPLPPGSGNAAITEADKQAQAQQALLKNPLYSTFDFIDGKWTEFFSNMSNKDQAAFNGYLTAVNKDISVKIADEDWANYLKQQGKTADQLTGDEKANYEKVQKQFYEVTKIDDHRQTALDKAQADLIKASGNQITQQQLDEFYANRYQEAKHAQMLLTKGEQAQPAEGAKPSAESTTTTTTTTHEAEAKPQHPENVEQGHRHTSGERHPAEHERRHTAQHNEEVSAEELNRQELARITGQNQEHDKWRNEIAVWEQRYMGRVNNNLSDQERARQDQAWYESQYGQQHAAQARLGEVAPAVAPGPGVPLGAPAVPGVAGGGYYQPYQQYQQQYQPYANGYGASYNNYGYNNYGYTGYGGYGVSGIGIGGIGIGIGFNSGYRPYYPAYRYPTYGYAGGGFYPGFSSVMPTVGFRWGGRRSGGFVII